MSVSYFETAALTQEAALRHAHTVSCVTGVYTYHIQYGALCMQIGSLHTEQGQLEQALNTYLEALEHSPENPDILTTLGITFLRSAMA